MKLLLFALCLSFSLCMDFSYIEQTVKDTVGKTRKRFMVLKSYISNYERVTDEELVRSYERVRSQITFLNVVTFMRKSMEFVAYESFSFLDSYTKNGRIALLRRLKSFFDTTVGADDPTNPWFYLKAYRNGSTILHWVLLAITLATCLFFFRDMSFVATLLCTLIVLFGVSLIKPEALFYWYVVAFSPLLAVLALVKANPTQGIPALTSLGAVILMVLMHYINKSRFTRLNKRLNEHGNQIHKLSKRMEALETVKK